MSFYVVPIVLVGTGARAARRPSFIDAAGITHWQMVDIADSAVVWADATPAQDALVAANASAILVPPVDNQIGAGALATVQADVEALAIPGDWITAVMTYRTVLRVVVGMAQLIQAVQNQGVNPVIAGHLNDTIGSFPANVQTALITGVGQIGLSTAGITLATTLRAALFNVGQQWVAGKGIYELGDL